MVGRKGAPQHDTRDGMFASVDVGSEDAVEGPDFWLKRSHTYPAREVHEPEAFFF